VEKVKQMLNKTASQITLNSGETKNLASKTGRSGRIRTRDLRFWRPLLFHLSYTPKGSNILSHFRQRV
jgi:hypothetical protein